MRLARLYDARGWEVRSVKADLALVGRSFEGFLATKALLAVGGLLAFPVLFGWLRADGLGRVADHPVLGRPYSSSLVFFFLPDVQIKREARRRGATSGTSSARSSTWSR